MEPRRLFDFISVCLLCIKLKILYICYDFKGMIIDVKRDPTGSLLCG